MIGEDRLAIAGNSRCLHVSYYRSLLYNFGMLTIKGAETEMTSLVGEEQTWSTNGYTETFTIIDSNVVLCGSGV